MVKCSNKVPKGWGNYTNMGRQIPGTRFIPFKTPLTPKALYNHHPPVDYFDTRSLMDHCSALGLVIDLTFANNCYYNSQDFFEAGIYYQKIKTRGHVIPNNQVINKFAKIVENFLEENEENEYLIGVHCTHGVNRTGYMICRYMTEQLGVPPDQAISDFESARGHEIERKNYVDHLRESQWMNSSQNDSSTNTHKFFTDDEEEQEEEADKTPGKGETPPYMPHRSRRENPSQSNENPLSSANYGRRNRRSLEWEVEAVTSEVTSGPSRGLKRSASTSAHEEQQNQPTRRLVKSPRLGKKYYNQYFKGQVPQQYDTDFYRRGGEGGIGPQRPPPRYITPGPGHGDGKHPRQYRGPRPYRSPPNKEEPYYTEFKTPNQREVRSPPSRETSQSNLNTPDMARVDGPTRNPLSPGLSTDVFSPENQFGRKRSKRFQPY